MQGDFPVIGWTLDDLLGSIGEQHLDFLCTKWQIDRYSWHTGDDVQAPLDLATLATWIGVPQWVALDEDAKMVATFGPVVDSNPALIGVRFAGVPITGAREWWVEHYGGQ